ncbi:endoplasmic reticulum-Golgi intermediate compartment protein 2-like [Oppia nitens]|uniref:endoplasmic reticulum-Golgi intermediate compartment protein 2-like n=1 Tax=Oppia nitens TaxID=1686743 RepID=UPI0023D9CDCD|nr:endoplasmic reticulum-Golgi intermediate compartment protein 2-like [Oppia nitens]
MTLIRRLISSQRSITELDAFTKVDHNFTKATTTGGTVSLLSYILIVILVVFEISMFFKSKIKFLYSVDTDFDSKLNINIDITVAMSCESIGADILDSTNTNNAYTYGRLVEEQTYFALSPAQRSQWTLIREVNNYLRNEHHSLQEVLWKSDVISQRKYDRDLPSREIQPIGPPDACRLHGTLVVNKVSGNFHITVGKHLPMPLGHAHISLFTSESEYNFSHRIERLSFGEYVPSIINPLEGEEKITQSRTQLYNYYVKVMSTDVQTSDLNLKTYQYSTTESERVIDHSSGSHGMPGIYFKYDIDAICAKVVEEYVPIWKFMIRLCGIVGGIYAISGLISSIANTIVDIVTCKYISSNILIKDIDNKGFQTVEGFSVPSDNLSLLYSPESNQQNNGINQ